MKKKAIKILMCIFIIPLLLILSYQVYLHVERGREYKSLDNVFKEMNYAEVYSDGPVKLPHLNNVLDSSQAFRNPDMIKGLPIKNTSLQEDESIVVYVGLKNIMVLKYTKELS